MAENREKRANQPEKAGSVQHDKYGRAVWKWAVDAGKHALDSTSVLLKRLDVPGLRLEEDKSPFSQDSEPSQPNESAGSKPGGYNPYGTSSRNTPSPVKPVAQRTRALPPQKGKRSFLNRLFGKR